MACVSDHAASMIRFHCHFVALRDVVMTIFPVASSWLIFSPVMGQGGCGGGRGKGEPQKRKKKWSEKGHRWKKKKVWETLVYVLYFYSILYWPWITPNLISPFYHSVTWFWISHLLFPTFYLNVGVTLVLHLVFSRDFWDFIYDFLWYFPFFLLQRFK